MNRAGCFCLAILTVLAFSAIPAYASPETNSRDKKISAAYSQHLYTSICAQQYRQKFPVHRLSEKDRAQLNQHTTQACACQYDAMAKVTTPETITDYVMYAYSSAPKGQKKQAPAKDYFDNSFRSMIDVVNSGDVRKKCGFVR